MLSHETKKQLSRGKTHREPGLKRKAKGQQRKTSELLEREECGKETTAGAKLTIAGGKKRQLQEQKAKKRQLQEQDSQ